MCSRILFVTAALILAPLGAKAADLVVWWEEGSYPQENEAVREIVAAFEQGSGKEVELVQHADDELFDKAQAALTAGQPPDFLFGTLVLWEQWAYADHLADLESALVLSSISLCATVEGWHGNSRRDADRFDGE